MKRAVCVHATQRAVEPARSLLRQLPFVLEQDDLLDEELFHLGGKGERARAYFLDVLQRAEARRPCMILTTCSLYTPFLPAARKRMNTPLLGVDESMIEHAARSRGSMALVGSLDAAIEFTAKQILDRSDDMGERIQIEQRVRVPTDACSTAEKTIQLAARMRQIARSVDQVFVVQLSLSGVDRYLSDADQRRILTSSRLALGRLHRMVEETER